VAALAVIVGDRLLTRLPVQLVRRISGSLLALLAVGTAIGAIRG
jgi:putative Ca2+/H+ antiporter (TMEM165/GDT1 family)